METSGNTILVTGGGSGIGEALAHRFHDLGNPGLEPDVFPPYAGKNVGKNLSVFF